MSTEHQTVCLFNGSRLAYPQNDKVAQFLYEGWFEANDMAFVSQFLTEGDNFFDLGAHAGLYSVLAMSRIGETGSIVACDPNPAILPWLERNLSTSALDNPKAVSPGETMIVRKGIAEKNIGANFYLGAEGAAAYASLEENEFTGECTQIELIAFDELVAATGIKSVDLVKVDIEGAEARFLEGAQRTISAHPNIVIMMECTEDNQRQFGETTQTLLNKIEVMGLKIFDVDISKQTITNLDIDGPLWHQNLILARDAAHIESRLKEADQPVRIQSIDMAKRGLASLKLYEDSQALQKLLDRLDNSVAKIAQLEGQFSTGEIGFTPTGVMAARLADSGAPLSEQADTMMVKIDDAVGRLKGAADAITSKLATISTVEFETLAAAKELAQALVPLGPICDKMTGDDVQATRLAASIDAGADGDAISITKRTKDLLDDQLGVLAGIVDAVLLKLNSELNARREEAALFEESTAESRRQLLAAREEVRQLGELAFALKKSKVTKLSGVLNLSMARAVHQMVDVYCGVAGEENENA